MWTVYVLKCADGKYYVGCSGSFSNRMRAHRNGEVHFTKTRLPFEIVITINFYDRLKAFQFEKYLKSGSGRAFAQKRFL